MQLKQVATKIRLSAATIEVVSKWFGKPVTNESLIEEPPFAIQIAEGVENRLAYQKLKTLVGRGYYTIDEINELYGAFFLQQTTLLPTELAEAIHEKTIAGETFQDIFDWMLGN